MKKVLRSRVSPEMLKQFIVVYLPNVSQYHSERAKDNQLILARYYNLSDAEVAHIYNDICKIFWHEVVTRKRWRRPRPRSTPVLLRIAAFEKPDDCGTHRRAAEGVFRLSHVIEKHRRRFYTAIALERIRSYLEMEAKRTLERHNPTLN